MIVADSFNGVRLLGMLAGAGAAIVVATLPLLVPDVAIAVLLAVVSGLATLWSP